MRILSCLVLLTAWTCCAAATAANVVYNFEGLTVGAPLAGQDNWVLSGFAPGLVGTGSGVNTSKVAQAGPATALASRPTRTNDANFSFPPLDPNGTAEIVEFDFSSDGLRTPGLWQGLFNLGGGGGSLGLGGFGVSGIGPNNGLFYYRDHFGLESGEAVPASVDGGDWVRIRATMDFTHPDGFGGFGAISLSYRNLTDGDVIYTPLASLQNLEMHLTTSPALWDRLEVFVIRDNANFNVQMDNLSIGPQVIPEPGTLTLIGIGAAGLVVIARRRKV
jgi:hypothetical protein